MTGIALSLPVTLIVAGVVIVGMAALLLRSWLKARAANALWIRLPAQDLPRLYYLQSGPPFAGADLAARVRFALNRIEARCPWTDGDIRRALTGWRIAPQPTATWTEAATQQKVGGEAIIVAGAIACGPPPKFPGLCHEMIHVIEFKLEGSENPGHWYWQERGMFTAAADYEAG